MTKTLDELDKQAEQYGGGRTGGSDFFEFQEGKNVLRILNFPEILATHFFGPGKSSVICIGIEEGCKFHGENAPKDDKGNEKRPSLKLITYVIDRSDSKVKLAELPLSIRYGLKDLQETDGFDFSDFPMPYDVQIIHDPKNSDPKAKYRMTGIPRMVPLTPEEQAAFDTAMAKMTPEQYVQKRKDKVNVGKDFDATIPSSSTKTDTPNSGIVGPIDYPTEEINPDDIPF